MSDLEGKTLTNAAIGAVVSTVAYLVPVVNLFAPIFGGGVAGYLQHQGASGGMKAGSVKGFVMTIPAIGLGLVASGMLAQIPVIGDLLAGSIVLLVIIVVGHSVALGFFGGLFGGIISGGPQKNAELSQGQSNTRGASTATETGTSVKSEAPSVDSGDTTYNPETNTNQQCRSCGDRVDPEASFCTSCGAESPLEPRPDNQSSESVANDQSSESVANDQSSESVANDQSSESVANDQSSEPDQSVEPEEKQTRISPAVTEAAGTVQRQTEMASSTARKLCRVLADESADENEIQSAIEDAVERLETGVAVSEAVKPAGRRSTIKVYRNIKQNLEEEHGQLPSAVESVVDRLIQANQKLEQQAETHETVVAEARMVCEVADRSDSVSFQSRGTEARLSELAAALEREDVIITEPSVSIESVAETVDRRARPASHLSQQLVDVLRELDDESEIETTIRESVRTIDEYAETQEMLSEIGTEDVRRRLDSLDRELASQDTPIYSHLADRIRELEALLDDPGSVDDIQLYAIYQEISYYDRTLLPRLSRSLSNSGAADTEELLSTVRRRIKDVHSEFVSVRPDHNHSIPKHFLDLAEQLVDNAEQELTNRPERAAGALLAADAVLDHVEELYERNEYSVMLRRLRG
jgi:hypothetical protein